MNVIAGALAFVLFCLLVGGGFYWASIGASATRCIFGDFVCSLTIATYILAFLTLAVFWATLQAAIAAWHAFTHEQRVAVAVQRCGGGTIGLRLSKIAQPRWARRAESHRPNGGVVQAYLQSALEDFRSTPPSDFADEIEQGEEVRYQRYDFDVLSAGRSPLVHGMLSVLSQSSRRQYHVPVGSIAAGEQAHLVLWLHDDVRLSDTLIWIDQANHAGSDEDVEFFPPLQEEINPFITIDLEKIPVDEGEMRANIALSGKPPPGVD